jgi:hypothetical protein
MDIFSDIRPVPADVLLSWPAPNYTNPQRRGPGLLIANGLLLPLALAVVTLRLYTRLLVVRSAGLDDLFVALALVNLPFAYHRPSFLSSFFVPFVDTISVFASGFFRGVRR